MWGLFSDHIVELEVVSANGTILKVSDKTNPELFFVRIFPPRYSKILRCEHGLGSALFLKQAMRGAGPSFGIITSLTLRTHEAPSNVILFEIDYVFPNPDSAAATLSHFQSWGLKSAPSQLGIRWSVKLNHTANSSKKIDLNWKLQGSFLGHMARFNRTISRLTSGFSVKGEVVSVERFDWLESVRALGGSHALSSEGINPSNDVREFSYLF
jgi:hypothetical protein